MGGCCSKNREILREIENEVEEDEGNIGFGDDGARVRSKGFSMFTQQGGKGINQDAMTVWVDYTGKEGTIFCGVFDGHGPSGHKVAHFVRDVLPSKLSEAFKLSQINGYNHSDVDDHDDDDDDDDRDDCSSSTTKDSRDVDNSHNSFILSWKTSFIESFKEVDEELSRNSSIECYCSGTTAVATVKQGDHLIIANLGDSRAILGTRGKKNQLVPAELTVDLKPNIPSEAERIRNCHGRIFAMDEEPDVCRMWLPDENYPGLAMARAFGDFCLKEYGLISVPEVTYRKLTDKDEFVVLATDGVWEVLTNYDVIKIVASANKRSMAAKLLVDRAVRAWRFKHPGCKIDDCAVICLFLKNPPQGNKSIPEVTQDNANHLPRSVSKRSGGSKSVNDENTVEPEEKLTVDEGMSRADTIINISRFDSVPGGQKTEENNEVLEVE